MVEVGGENRLPGEERSAPSAGGRGEQEVILGGDQGPSCLSTHSATFTRAELTFYVKPGTL